MTMALIIEDNEDNRVLIGRLLEKSGYETSFAETGWAGYEMAAELMPDFILLDIQLPDIDGIEVLKKIRETAETKDIPVIAFTSHAMAGDRDRLIAEGCSGYLVKPIDPLHVVGQIEDVLRSVK